MITIGELTAYTTETTAGVLQERVSSFLDCCLGVAAAVHVTVCSLYAHASRSQLECLPSTTPQAFSNSKKSLLQCNLATCSRKRCYRCKFWVSPAHRKYPRAHTLWCCPYPSSCHPFHASSFHHAVRTPQPRSELPATGALRRQATSQEWRLNTVQNVCRSGSKRNQTPL